MYAVDSRAAWPMKTLWRKRHRGDRSRVLLSAFVALCMLGGCAGDEPPQVESTRLVTQRDAFNTRLAFLYRLVFMEVDVRWVSPVMMPESVTPGTVRTARFMLVRVRVNEIITAETPLSFDELTLGFAWDPRGPEESIYVYRDPPRSGTWWSEPRENERMLLATVRPIVSGMFRGSVVQVVGAITVTPDGRVPLSVDGLAPGTPLTTVMAHLRARAAEAFPGP